MNFEGDFDFESSNAQFNKEDIAKELMDKLKISGLYFLQVLWEVTSD